MTSGESLQSSPKDQKLQRQNENVAFSSRCLDTQAEQNYKNRIRALQKLNDELTKMVEITQMSDYAQLLNKLNRIEADHASEIKSYKLKISQLEAEAEFKANQHQNIFQETQHRIETAEAEAAFLRKEIRHSGQEISMYREQFHKSQKKLKNQEELIDSFKTSIDEQIQLQKQVLKANFKEQEANLKLKFEQKLKKVECHYQKKLKNQDKKESYTQYKKQLGELKKHLTDKKRQFPEELIVPDFRYSCQKVKPAEFNQVEQAQANKENQPNKIANPCEFNQIELSDFKRQSLTHSTDKELSDSSFGFGRSKGNKTFGVSFSKYSTAGENNE